jgi:hypothetical protein
VLATLRWVRAGAKATFSKPLVPLKAQHIGCCCAQGEPQQPTNKTVTPPPKKQMIHTLLLCCTKDDPPPQKTNQAHEHTCSFRRLLRVPNSGDTELRPNCKLLRREAPARC